MQIMELSKNFKNGKGMRPADPADISAGIFVFGGKAENGGCFVLTTAIFCDTIKIMLGKCGFVCPRTAICY